MWATPRPAVAVKPRSHEPPSPSTRSDFVSQPKTPSVAGCRPIVPLSHCVRMVAIALWVTSCSMITS